MTRRGSLVKLGGAGIAAALGWKAVDEASGAGPAAVASGAVSCVLAPEQTEGPYFLPGDKVRRNVTEGKAGVLLTLKLTVLDVSTCKPIKGAAVDIWHCDAVGTYAATTNKTFLRGIQKTDAKGVATFKTVYPGWYQGRTVHIHVKVSLGRQRRPHGAAVLPRLGHGQGLHAVAVQLTAGALDAQPRRLDLSQRRQPLDAEAEEGGERLHGLDHHGRPEIGRKSGDFRPRVVSDSRREPRPPCRSRRRKP